MHSHSRQKVLQVRQYGARHAIRHGNAHLMRGLAFYGECLRKCRARAKQADSHARHYRKLERSKN